MVATRQMLPRHVQQVRQTYSLMGLVGSGSGSGIGLALVQASVARVRMPGVVVRPIVLPAHAVSELHLAWCARDERDNPAVERMRQLVLAEALSDK